MDDTAPEVREMMSALLMRRSGEERFIMGALMFDAARELVIASLPENLPLLELRRKLFERIYGFPLPSFNYAPGELRDSKSAESK